MRSLVPLACLFLLGQASCLAAVDAFMGLKVTGSKAVPSDAANHWVKILGFQQGVRKPVSVGTLAGGPTTSGVATADEVTLQMASDSSIATMMTGLSRGTSFSLTLQILRNYGDPVTGATVLEEMFFEGIRFSQISARASDGDSFLSFDISFQYQQLTITHTSVSDRGVVGAPTATGWNFIVSAPLNVTPRVPDALVYGTEGTLPVPVNPDRDGDGMPNTWEDLYGFNADSSLDAGLDADGDGFSNLKEYIAGTHPRQGNSFFQVKVTLVAAAPQPTMELTWNAVAGKSYRVEASARPDGGFTTLYSLTPAADGIQTYRPPAGSGAFFRLAMP